MEKDRNKKGYLLDLEDIGQGDHICQIYGSRDEYLHVISHFILIGLRRGEKIVYITDKTSPETILDLLIDIKTEPEFCLQTSQVNVLKLHDTYMRGGVFIPGKMIELLRSEEEEAISEGFSGLRVTGEMTWALRGYHGSERLFEYEYMLNEYFPRSKSLAICQYSNKRFEHSVLLDVLRSHPVAIIGKEIYQNIFYTPLKDLINKSQSAVEYQILVKNLAEYKQLKMKLFNMKSYEAA